MNPYERAVVEAAVQVVADTANGFYPTSAELTTAVHALLAHRAALAPDAGEERTWAEVCEGDEVFLARTGKWWEIIESRHHADGRMRIVAKGAPKILTPAPETPVTIRRGASGRAADTLTTVMLSGPEGVWLSKGDTAPNAPAVDRG